MNGPDQAAPSSRGLSPQTIGNVWLYYVCYRLSLAGWNVMPTARNARGVDIVAYSQDATQTRTIQVKALSRRNPVPLGGDLERLYGDFVVVCCNAREARPDCFVLTPKEIRRLAHRGEKDGEVSFWLQPRQYDKARFREAWKRIGRSG